MKALHLLVLLVCLAGQAWSQVADTTRKYSSEDLITTYYDEDFRPYARGRSFVKAAFSLREQDLENVPRLLDRVVQGNDFRWTLDLSGGYYVGNYFLVGFRVNYTDSKFEGTVIDSNSDTLMSNTISRNTDLVPFIRTSIPLTRNHRLSFFNDIGVGVGFGNSLSRDIKNQDEIQKKFTEEFSFNIGLTPGITFFAVENFAFEVGINLIGYQLTAEKGTTNGTEESRRVSHDVNFRINLLTLNFGVAYFFGTKKK